MVQEQGTGGEQNAHRARNARRQAGARRKAGGRPTQGGLAPVKGSDAAMRVLLAAAVQHDYRPFANGEQVLLFGGKTAMIKGDF